MAKEPTRAPRKKPKPYNRQARVSTKAKDAPKTSAKKRKNGRENLTTADWLEIYAYADQHPVTSQADIVNHFKTKKDNALIFTQGTLSRKLKDRERVEIRAKAYPNALSSKRDRVVTRPDVERALFLWVRHMEEKGEMVTGPMLKEKRGRFEKLLDIPEEERLLGEGWIPPFCRAHKIKEYRRHGEAGSVDLIAVEVEKKRMQRIVASYAPRNRFNADESALLPFAPPDRGLGTMRQSGKKKSKFRITVLFTCNADGSEKLPPFFIGKYKRPWCFGRQTPQQQGFYYRHNKKAWMTSDLFDEFIQQFDAKMRNEKRHVLLTIDNFSGHFISYVPTNIQIEYFEPNMTLFVQPLDAGIIRCFKAHYRKSLCMRAIDRDEEGAEDIFDLNLLEGMKMANKAWDSVSGETIKNCWKHTGIQTQNFSNSDSTSNPAFEIKSDPGAWDILREFASSEMTLPLAEERLQKHLGEHYKDEDWQPSLKAVMDAEGDVAVAQAALQRLSTSCLLPKLVIRLPGRLAVSTDNVEEELMNSVEELKRQNRIFGELPTVDELVDSVHEKKATDSPYNFTNPDKDIVAQVRHETAVKNGEVIEIDSDEDSDDENNNCTDISRSDTIKLCDQLEKLSLRYGNSSTSLELTKQLRQFRVFLPCEELAKSTQTTLDGFVVQESKE